MRSQRIAVIAATLSLLTLAGTRPEAGNLPPLRCGLVRAIGATCHWSSDGTCTWEEGGTPTICEPVGGPTIRLRPAGTYRGGYFNNSASASVAFDARTRRMFIANVAAHSIDVVDLQAQAIDPSRPARLANLFSIDVASLIPALPPETTGLAVPRHLTVRSDGLLAVVLQNVQDPTQLGRVALYRTDAGATTPPAANVVAGYMPARAAFTPDGQWLLVANEGEPSQDYVTDRPGLVTIVDLRRGAARAVARNIDFQAFDPFKAQLVDKGVRISGPDLSTADPKDTAAVSVDVEPADVAISPDSRVAWVTLPESNSVAVLDIRHQQFIAILPFGLKNHAAAGNALDPTDDDDAEALTNGIPGINIQNWPMSGMYMSRRVAIDANFWLPLLVYPSEGVRRNFAAFSDEIRLNEMGPALNQMLFPLFPPAPVRALRLKVSRVDGDKDGDGVIDQIYSFGGRSFSIRLPDNRLIYDSGDDFERITAQATLDTIGAFEPTKPYFLFNTPDDENSLDENSDLRGPEPISVTTGVIERHAYAFVGLERVSGIMAYDISNPFRAQFAYYINNRNFGLNPKTACIKRAPDTEACKSDGDLSPEDIVFVSERDSPVRAPLLLVSNATSGSATIYEIDAADR
jgi:hypothetical protein